MSTQPGAFRAPTRISTSAAQTGGASGPQKDAVKVVVTDRSNGTVQVFSSNGECLAMLRVLEVNAACLWMTGGGGHQRLNDAVECIVAGTDKGIEVSFIASQECMACLIIE